jgi:hypothetical protein
LPTDWQGLGSAEARANASLDRKEMNVEAVANQWADAAANNWRDRKNVAAPNTLDLMVRPPAVRDNEREAVSWRSTDALK